LLTLPSEAPKFAGMALRKRQAIAGGTPNPPKWLWEGHSAIGRQSDSPGWLSGRAMLDEETL
jgi:hypothetical protein